VRATGERIRICSMYGAAGLEADHPLFADTESCSDSCLTMHLTPLVFRSVRLQLVPKSFVSRN
jgi:hypothetical protein